METIKNNQDILMERERLAGLGQLIGGIAHNLKTPIMSIAGAVQGLENLIREYDESIDDPLVNSQDHHDIAKDMEEWIPKIRAHLEYMSDIITTVKGQAYWGVLGMFLAVPVVAVLKIIIDDWIEYKNQKKYT